MDDVSLRLFKLSSAGFCCAQIMYKLALEDEGSCNDDLVRSAQGLCRGIADTQQTCGVLSGGIGVLGLYAAKAKEEESANEDFAPMVQAFHEWFSNRMWLNAVCRADWRERFSQSATKVSNPFAPESSKKRMSKSMRFC